METDQGRAQSAALHFHFSGARITIFLRAFGDPEHVRKAMRAACSHRRTIVTTRPHTFVGNVYMHLAKQAQDVAEIWDSQEAYDHARKLYEWNYFIQPEGIRDNVFIHFGGSKHRPMRLPLFSFLGTEYRRDYKLTPARKRALKGRPRESWLTNGMWRKIENLTPAQKARYERLEQARAAKQRGKSEQQQRITKEQNGKALGLKDRARNPKRIVRVDFSEVYTPMQSLSRLDRMELDPDYERELDRLYDLEGGQQP